MRGARNTGDFRYLAAVCGAVAADRAVPGADGVDTAGLAALARRHRIATRSADALAVAIASHDPAAAAALGAHVRTRRLAALDRTARMAALSAALTNAGIRHLGIKGPVLAQQLYGDVAARDSKDIDLLVDPAAAAQAAAVFARLGYADTAPVNRGGSAGKHLTYAGHGIEIEVHTRLFDVDALLPLSFAHVWPRREPVALGGTAVPALSRADTLLYLCAHGAEHVWFRLKWLEDIARIVTRPDADAEARAVLDDALALARETGAEAILVTAMRLVGDVFGIDCPAIARDTRTSRALVRLSQEALAAPAELASAPPVGWLLRKLPVQWGMARTWRYRSGLIRHLALASRDFDAPLPPALRWLRLPLRPAMLLRDRWRGR